VLGTFLDGDAMPNGLDRDGATNVAYQQPSGFSRSGSEVKFEEKKIAQQDDCASEDLVK
jgi:hypothetical protein